MPLKKELGKLSRIEEQALVHARSAQTTGAGAVEIERARLAESDQEIRAL